MATKTTVKVSVKHGKDHLAPGGRDRAALRAALLVADGHRPALRRRERPTGAAEIEDLGVPAENDRDQVRAAGESSCLSGGDPVTGPEVGRAEAAAEFLERDGDHHRGRRATVLGEQLAGESLEQGAEGLPETARVRQVGDLVVGTDCAGGSVARAGHRLQVGLQAGRDVVGDADTDVGRPVAPDPHRQQGGAAGGPLLGLEPAAFLLLGEVGRQHLQDLAAEHAQPRRIEVASLGEQVRLGLQPQLGVQVVGKLVERLDDHAGLPAGDLAGRQRRPDLVPPRRQRLGEPLRRHRLAATAAGLVRQPRPRRARARVLCDVVGAREHAQSQLVQPLLGAGQLQQGRSLVRCGEVQRVHVGDVVQRGVHAVGAPQQRVLQ